MSRIRHRLIIAFASLAIALSACGSDDSSSDGWSPGEDNGAEGHADTGGEGSGGGSGGGGGGTSDAGGGAGDDAGGWEIQDGGEADGGQGFIGCVSDAGECVEIEPGSFSCQCADGSQASLERQDCMQAVDDACGGDSGTATSCEESGTTETGCEWTHRCQQNEASKDYSCSCSFQCPDGTGGGSTGWGGTSADSCQEALEQATCADSI